MVVEGYQVGKLVVLITAEGKLYVHQRKSAVSKSGPVTNPADQMEAIRNAIPLRDALDNGFPGSVIELEAAIAGAIRTLIAESYEEVE
jgi:hypothetical protein